MNSNTCSPEGPERPPGSPPGSLATLAADLDALAAEDLDRLPDAVRAERVLVLRRLVDRLEGQWLNELAGVDARGAAGAEQGIQAPSTFRGPLTTTAQALGDGDLSVAHAAVLAHGTSDLPTQVAAEAATPHRRDPTGQKARLVRGSEARGTG